MCYAVYYECGENRRENQRSGQRCESGVSLGYNKLALTVHHPCSEERLGYLIDTLGLDQPGLVSACRDRVSSGVSALDPFLPKLEEWVEASHGKVRADVVHDKLVAVGYQGSERTTPRAVAAAKKAQAERNHADSRSAVELAPSGDSFGATDEFGAARKMVDKLEPSCAHPCRPATATPIATPFFA